MDFMERDQPPLPDFDRAEKAGLDEEKDIGRREIQGPGSLLDGKKDLRCLLFVSRDFQGDGSGGHADSFVVIGRAPFGQADGWE
jgi:hypothetical protein